MSIEVSQTVGEIAAGVPGATREFEKLGIDYCCGGTRTLGEACTDARISVSEALTRLQSGLSAAQLEPDRNWRNEPLAELIGHITRTHHAFVREESPRIEKLLEKVVSVHGANHAELLEVQAIFGGLAAYGHPPYANDRNGGTSSVRGTAAASWFAKAATATKRFP